MTQEKHIRGKIVSGRGEAKNFIRINWVREQCLEKVGFDPFPGTLNILVNPEDFNFMRRLSCSQGKRLVPPPQTNFCEARLLDVKVNNNTAAALLFPMVDDYYSDILEIAAPLALKEHLGLKDSDLLQLSIVLPPKMHLPQGIIFDLDGTLIDSIGPYYSVLCEGCRELNLDIPPRKEAMELMGKGDGFWEAWDGLLMAKQTGLEREERRQMFITVLLEIWHRKYEREVAFFPGVDELLCRLQAKGVILGLVTSSNYEKKVHIFTKKNLNPELLFHAIISGTDTVKNKPDPEPMLRCLEKLGIPADKCFCLGDSPCDILAGKRAGLMTVGVLTGTGTRQSLSKEGADFILDCTSDLAEMFDI